MPQPFNLRAMGLLSIWLGGIYLALGSSSYDPDEDEMVDPVEVEVMITSTESFEIDNDDTEDTLSSIQLSGSFTKAGDAGITLRETPVTLDTSTSIIANISPNDPDNLLTGALTVDVTAALEFGLNRAPEQGQISVMFDETSIIIDFDGDADNIVLQAGNETRPAISFSQLRNRFSDTDANLFERAASKGYRLLENIWQYARIVETLRNDIDDQREMLESMGVNQSLTLTCDNSSGTRTPSYSLSWADASGTGQGSAGNGDRFEATWENCNFAEDDRYLDRDLELDEYRLINNSEPREMFFVADFAMIIGLEEITSVSDLDIDRNSVTGVLTISAIEIEQASTQ